MKEKIKVALTCSGDSYLIVNTSEENFKKYCHKHDLLEDYDWEKYTGTQGWDYDIYNQIFFDDICELEPDLPFISFQKYRVYDENAAIDLGRYVESAYLGTKDIVRTNNIDISKYKSLEADYPLVYKDLYDNTCIILKEEDKKANVFDWFRGNVLNEYIPDEINKIVTDKKLILKILKSKNYVWQGEYNYLVENFNFENYFQEEIPGRLS